MAKKTTKTYSTKEILAKAKKDKPPRESFEKIVTGHAFKLLGRGVMPEGSHFWCAFCGGRGKYYVEIVRDDEKKYKVGANCVSKVGLVPPPKEQKKKTKGGTVVHVVNGDAVVEPPKTENEKALDDEIDSLLNSL